MGIRQPYIQGPAGPQGTQGPVGPAGGGGGGSVPIISDLAGMATLTADHTVSALWGTFDGAATVTVSDGTNTVVGTVVNGTTGLGWIDTGSGLNNSAQGCLQAFAAFLSAEYLTGNIDVKPVFASFYPYMEFGQARFRTGNTLGLTTRSGADVDLITVVVAPSPGADGALTLTLPA